MRLATIAFDTKTILSVAPSNKALIESNATKTDTTDNCKIWLFEIFMISKVCFISELYHTENSNLTLRKYILELIIYPPFNFFQLGKIFIHDRK
ncbi:hypothetical protein, partial [Pseudomonas simiae]|uniref:hypothetical protein n=1 Tax=Pseudomonas simiae TaxID=321846 RepID=UPI001F159963